MFTGDSSPFPAIPPNSSPVVLWGAIGVVFVVLLVAFLIGCRFWGSVFPDEHTD